MTEQQRRPQVYNLLIGPIIVNSDDGTRVVSDWPPIIRLVADRMEKRTPHVTFFHLAGRQIGAIERDIVAWWVTEVPTKD